MAEEPTIVQKTFEELFEIYSNYKIDPLSIDNEIYNAILLTQIDFWLEKSKLLKTVFSLTHTGLAWMKFKKWRLDYDEFLEFINEICSKKNLNVDEIKNIMTDAGSPTTDTEPIVAVK